MLTRYTIILKYGTVTFVINSLKYKVKYRVSTRINIDDLEYAELSFLSY